jgi:hypothetical protein
MITRRARTEQETLAAEARRLRLLLRAALEAVDEACGGDEEPAHETRAA